MDGLMREDQASHQPHRHGRLKPPTGQMRPVPCRASARGLSTLEVQAQPANDINALIKFIQVSVPVDT